ncbi:hypothetical protein [Burkholderia ubonensis]|uniref:hypothetical protein n=1 Tax=Burkholderia ubonensis TaxID=101571 RepID=UPI0012F84E7E|nr:hypothetical protein [Burkholderia ubonensis]
MITIDVHSLTQTQQWALRECAQYKRGYPFKPKTMESLADMGLAQPVEARGFILTDAGRRAVDALKGAREAKSAADQRAYLRHA